MYAAQDEAALIARDVDVRDTFYSTLYVPFALQCFRFLF